TLPRIPTITTLYKEQSKDAFSMKRSTKQHSPSQPLQKSEQKIIDGYPHITQLLQDQGTEHSGYSYLLYLPLVTIQRVGSVLHLLFISLLHAGDQLTLYTLYMMDNDRAVTGAVAGTAWFISLIWSVKNEMGSKVNSHVDAQRMVNETHNANWNTMKIPKLTSTPTSQIKITHVYDDLVN
ncbi:6538_t:CDS:2, partial [Ambispora gerdemannii]